jgi:hypothetical protein
VAIRESQASADRGHFGTTCEAAAGETERPESTTAPEIPENADHAPRVEVGLASRDAMTSSSSGCRERARDADHCTVGVRVAEQDMSRVLPARYRLAQVPSAEATPHAGSTSNLSSRASTTPPGTSLTQFPTEKNYTYMNSKREQGSRVRGGRQVQASDSANRFLIGVFPRPGAVSAH